MEKARRILRESQESLKEGYGFINQREDCLKFEKVRRFEIVEEYQLVETSVTWNREKFDGIIRKTVQERNEIPVIVFPRVDRFARNLEAAGYYLGLLRQNGLKVGFAEEDLVVDNETSTITVLMFYIHSFKADQDGKQIKHNLLAGRDKLATEAHELPNGMVIWPFDYTPKRLYGVMSTGRPALNPERTSWVRKWVDWLLDDGVGLLEACRNMDNSGVPPPRGGKKWSSATMRRILRSRQLISEFHWKGKLIYKDEGETVLTEERFATLQKRLDEIKERSYYNAAKLDYPPLRKMVFCSEHEKMYGVPIKGTAWYRCPACGKYISARSLWENIQQEIKDRLMREERLIPAIKTQFENKTLVTTLEEDIRVKSTEISKWDDTEDKAFRLALVTNYPEAKLAKRIDEIRKAKAKAINDKERLEARLRVVRQQILDEEGIKRFCRLARKNIDSLTKNQWHVFLKLLRLRIIVYHKKLVRVNLALPAIKDTEIEFSRL